MLGGLAVWTTFWLAVANKSPAADFKTGNDFRAALERSAGRSWSSVTLRDALRELSQDRQIAILLDRRLDPSQELNLAPPNGTLRDLLDAVAKQMHVERAEVGSVVYFGSLTAARTLPVFIAARTEELSKLGTPKGAASPKDTSFIRKLTPDQDKKENSPTKPRNPWSGRTGTLLQRHSFQWADLDQPREVLKHVAAKFQFEIVNLDEVPHDLWAAGALPQVTAIEALSLLLMQFDATFEFLSDRRAIQIVPITKDTTLERTYSLTATSGEQTLRAFQEQFPNAQFARNGFKLTVTGTPEQHAEIAEILRKPSSDKTTVPATSKKTGGVSPLLKNYTLTVKNKTIKDVLQQFEAVGVKFVYDPDQLRIAGISLNDRVDLDVKGVSGGKLLRDLLEDHGFDVRIEGNTVWISPRPKSPR